MLSIVSGKKETSRLIRWNAAVRLLPLLLFMVVGLGCGQGSKWLISLQNKSPDPVDIRVEMEQGTAQSDGSISGLKSGETVILIAGVSETVLQKVQVTRGKDVEVLTPKIALIPGKKYLIQVNETGKAEVVPQ